jgi:hypothetical protein
MISAASSTQIDYFLDEESDANFLESIGFVGVPSKFKAINSEMLNAFEKESASDLGDSSFFSPVSKQSSFLPGDGLNSLSICSVLEDDDAGKTSPQSKKGAKEKAEKAIEIK